MKKSVVSVSVLLFAACFVAGGQGFSLGDIWRRLCAPNPSLDSTRIFQPNFTARASICYNTGRFYVNVWADYTRFVFQNTPRSFSSEIGNMTLTQNGEFSSWMVTLQLNYRF